MSSSNTLSMASVPISESRQPAGKYLPENTCRNLIAGNLKALGVHLCTWPPAKSVAGPTDLIGFPNFLSLEASITFESHMHSSTTQQNVWIMLEYINRATTRLSLRAFLLYFN